EKATHGEAQREGWITIQRSHAIANGLYVAAVNRIGLEKDERGGDGLEFWGSSFVCDPFGTILAQAPVDQEAIVTAEVDPARIEETRRGWPFLRDRRIDAYGDLTRRLIDEG
ncbi:MAG TPA: nitrilase-related carbon-nitrogen hydrolase, partial [Candidatus Sumerlaeota bacterium]|nr:nitrilase-related carbon-nitrogen hydrolase [Candidatus Sumerlaeota bacterium]